MGGVGRGVCPHHSAGKFIDQVSGKVLRLWCCIAVIIIMFEIVSGKVSLIVKAIVLVLNVLAKYSFTDTLQ